MKAIKKYRIQFCDTNCLTLNLVSNNGGIVLAVAHEEKDRLSIVTFYAPSYEIELGPMQEFVDENHPIHASIEDTIMESIINIM
jgi:hypothetical protein